MNVLLRSPSILLRLVKSAIRLSAYPKQDRRIAAESWVALLTSRIRLHALPARTIVGELSLDEQSAASDPYTPSTEIETLVRVFSAVAADHGVSLVCLPRALALKKLLQRRGVPAIVRIGVRPAAPAGHTGSRLEGHAWVEVGGTVVNDSPDAVRNFKVWQVSNRKAD